MFYKNEDILYSILDILLNFAIRISFILYCISDKVYEISYIIYILDI